MDTNKPLKRGLFTKKKRLKNVSQNTQRLF